MNKRSIFNFEYKVIALMVVIFIIVLITGFSAYYRYSSMLAMISQSVRPDTRLVLSHSLNSELTELSNIAKSHSLTEDFTYRKNYILIRNQVWEKMDEFKDLNDDFGNDLDVVYLDSLINDKMVVLDGIIYAEDPFRVQTALGKVVLNIESSDYQVKTSLEQTYKNTNSEKLAAQSQEELKIAAEKIIEINREEEKLQKKKKRAEKRSKTDVVSELDSLLNLRQKEAALIQREFSKVEEFEESKRLAINDIYKEIESVSNEELGIEKKIKTSQLELISLDNILSLQIASFFDEFELNEKKKIAEATKLAEEENVKTTRYFAIFTFFVTLLLVFIAYIVFQYVKKNNLYKSALKRAKFETDQLVKTRERLMTTITHEIRTPMHAIAGFSEQLSKQNLTEEQAEYVNMIRTSSTHLTYLVNDVLDLSKLQSGKMKLNMEPFSLKQLVQEVVLFSRELVQDNRLEIRSELDSKLESFYLGDMNRLRQILLNLMSNAVKFTDEGFVDLKIEMIHGQEGAHQIKITICDTGIGMDKEELEVAFDEFKQFGSRTGNKIAGTGLGLSITKRLVEMHKGTIEIASEKGKGTTIEIDLKLELSKIKPKKMEEKEKLQLLCSSILVVDDEVYNRKLLKSILKNYNVTLSEATHGGEAIELLQQNDIELMLLDARMPVMDGMQTVQTLRTEYQSINDKVKIILLTAAGIELDELIQQVDGYIAKPFTEEILITEINRVFSMNENDVEQNPAETMKEHHIAVNFENLRSLSGSDHLFYKDMLETFISTTNNSMENIRVAVKNKDFDLIADEAHKIASPCRHLGALKMHQLLREIENDARNVKEIKTIKSNVKLLDQEVQIVLQVVDKELQSIA